jgi:hypothetical protein
MSPVPPIELPEARDTRPDGKALEGKIVVVRDLLR